MTPGIERHFPSQEREAIRQATERAEERTSGEVVSYVVGRCDFYPETLWIAATLGALAAALAAVAWHGQMGAWGGSPMAWIALPAFAGASLGFLAALAFAPLRRWLVRPGDLERRVAARAAEAFIEEEIFATRERTGILIFVALFEHRVLVMADAGIHQKVEPGTWIELSDKVARGIKTGRASETLVEAIRDCGRLLAEHGLARAEDDTNELPNHLRTRRD